MNQATMQYKIKNDSKKIIKVASFSLFFLFILVYSFFRAEDLLFGVKIKDVNLQDNTTIHQSTTTVSGNARNATHLTLNGREISVDKEGNFTETIALLPGYNVVKIEATDKFKNTDEKNFHLMGISNDELTYINNR